jgi:DHA3 family tetracycline resistance protein-like MFS transporter
MISRRPALRTILLIGFFYGLYSEGFDRLWVKHLLDGFSLPAFIQFEPIVWIGLIRGCGMLMAIAATEILRRRSEPSRADQLGRTLFLLTSLLFASLLVFARAKWLLLAVLTFWLIYISRVLINPLYTAWVNQRLDSRVRATVLSLSGQVDALGQIAGGPLVGAVGSILSVRAALTLSSLLLSPALLIYIRSAKRRAAR